MENNSVACLDIFKSILDNLLIGAVITEDTGNNFNKIIYANSRLLKVLGYKLEDVKDKKIIDFVSENDKNKAKELLLSDKVEPYEAQILTKNGDSICAKLSGVNIADSNLRISTIVDINDVREEHYANIESNKLSAIVETVNLIAHQWRQPLSIISSLASSMILNIKYNPIDKNELISSLEKIVNKSNNLSKTIEVFIDSYSKNDFKEYVKLDNLIEIAKDNLKLSFKEAGVVIEKKYHTKDEENCYIYKNSFILTITSILKNAIDIFKNKGTKEPKITINLDEKDSEYIIIISDNAGGIDKDIIEKIFYPYFTTKHQEYGVGLNLFTARNFIEHDCGGRICVYNDNYGACFKIVIPKKKD